jgi:hypothetical protein
MSAAWDRLAAELDAWGEAGQRATLWCRDDDAIRESPALRQLLHIFDAFDIPIAIAAIPAAIEASLTGAVSTSPRASVLQHGYAHRNHAPAPARRCELGLDRPMAEMFAELVAGRSRLEREFVGRFVAALVPPWNRIDRQVVATLAGAGFHGLSTFGARAAEAPARGIVQSNTHVDLIAWRTNRGFVGTDIAIDRLVGHLRARRERAADAAEASGILTHHLDMDDAAWRFLTDLMTRTREHPAVAWLDASAVFAGVRTGNSTSGRSA